MPLCAELFNLQYDRGISAKDLARFVDLEREANKVGRHISGLY